MVRIILASASPARRATLSRAGVIPEVMVSAVDEPAVVAASSAQTTEDITVLLARAKAEDVAARPEAADALVLGCDSMLDLDGVRYGKPGDDAEAAQRWRLMSGRSGVLHTGHWLIDTRDPADGGTGATIGASAATTVHFAGIGEDEIAAYVATGEPLAVAGAFTIDGLGGAFVRGIEGDHHNVVGISLPVLRDLLSQVGVPWTSLWPR